MGTTHPQKYNQHTPHTQKKKGEVNVSLPMSDASIAGSVALSGKTENITDAYLDDRFDKAFDQRSGFRTKSILCMPIFRGYESGRKSEWKADEGEKAVIGVLELMNKKGPEENEVFIFFFFRWPLRGRGGGQSFFFA